MKIEIIIIMFGIFIVGCAPPKQATQKESAQQLTQEQVTYITKDIRLTDSTAHAPDDTVFRKSTSVDTSKAEFVPYDSPPEVIRIAKPHSSKPFLTTRDEVDRVILKLWVTKEGSVKRSVVVSSTNSMFNREALRLSMAWFFKPAFMRGDPVACWVQIPIDFQKN